MLTAEYLESERTSLVARAADITLYFEMIFLWRFGVTVADSTLAEVKARL